MPALTADQLRRLRTRAQGLHPRFASLADAVRAVVGVQAQLPSAMQLALHARVDGLRDEDVETAIREKRVVRSWFMRGTLHLVLAEDVRWLIALLGPIFSASDQRRRTQLGLDETTCASGLRAIRAILSHEEPLTRYELLDRLVARGVEIPREGQALIHLISYAAFEGVLCLAGERDNEPLYALLDHWVGEQKTLSREAALAELARRYLTGYGPATLKDFVAWSGLKMAEAKRGWAAVRSADGLIEIQVEDRAFWMLASQASLLDELDSAEPVVRLLPAFDAYLLGYSDRTDLVRPAFHGEVYHGGQTVPVVLVDGLAAGVWRYARKGKRLAVTVRPFAPLDTTVQERIAAKADSIGRFWDLPVTLTFEPG